MRNHYISRFRNDSNSYKAHNKRYERIARHDIFTIEFSHNSYLDGRLMMKGGREEIFNTLSLFVFRISNTWLSLERSVS